VLKSVYDVGLYVNHAKHHRHSHYLIMHGELRGFTPEEVTIVATVAQAEQIAHDIGVSLLGVPMPITSNRPKIEQTMSSGIPIGERDTAIDHERCVRFTIQFSRRPTDDELMSLHDHINRWGDG